MLTTQISGKIERTDDRLLMLRRRLVHLGVDVRFPESDQIVASRGGMDFTFDIGNQSVAATERALFEAISNSSLHILHNAFQDLDGYIGKSAGIETCAAMAWGRPIVALHTPVVASHVPQRVREIINQNVGALAYVCFDRLPDHELIPQLTEVSQATPTYRIADRAALLSDVDAHLRSFEALDV